MWLCAYVGCFMSILPRSCLCTWWSKRPRQFYLNAYQRAAGFLHTLQRFGFARHKVEITQTQQQWFYVLFKWSNWVIVVAFLILAFHRFGSNICIHEAQQQDTVLWKCWKQVNSRNLGGNDSAYKTTQNPEQDWSQPSSFFVNRSRNIFEVQKSEKPQLCSKAGLWPPSRGQILPLVWKLLSFPPDVRLISLMIHWCRRRMTETGLQNNTNMTPLEVVHWLAGTFLYQSFAFT